MRVNLPLAPPWTGDDAPRRLYEDLMARIGALPSVTHASVGGRLPFDAARGGLDAWRPDRPALKVRSLMSPATEGFLASIGARLVAGRDFAPTDTGAAPAVVIVNEELARALWPGEDAVGRAITYQFFSGPVEATVIGIAGSIRYDGPRGDPRPEYFVPFRQARVMPGTFLVRTAGVDPIALVPQIRAVLRDVEPTRSVTLDRFATLDDRIARSYARPRFFLVLFGAFAVSAFLLAAFGIYGTMTFWIGERWRELGIRLALGATRERVAAHVVGRGALVAGVGLAFGLLATLAAGRMISALLFGVTASDPATLAAAATALALVAMTACLVPARRISRLDPSRALRE
jgi:predicted permease